MAKLFKKLFRKASASTAALTLGLASVALGAVSSPAEAADSYSFARCVEDKHAANVLIMMDETGSVFNSDPQNLRVAGAEVLINRLQRVADVYSTPVNVMLAGFGDNFVERSAGWVSLAPDATDGSNSLVATARQWASKTSNQRETDTLSGLAGATRAFAAVNPAESCKLFVFFKDGVDFQSFNKVKATVDGGSTGDYKEVQALLDKSKTDEANALARDEICRRGGLADALRSDDNMFTFGVALNTSKGDSPGLADFSSLIQGGGDCGTLPPKGRLLKVDDSSNLPSIFGSALDPDFVPSSHTGAFTLNMPRALTSVNILSSRIASTFDDFTITLAPTCSQTEPIKIVKGTDIMGDIIGGSVKVTAKWAGANPSESQTLNITLQHTALTDPTCWVGKWTINPGSETMSELYFDADLSAVAKFTNDKAVLVKGTDGKASQKFKLKLERPSDKSTVEVAALDPALDFKVTGYLREAASKKVVASSWDSLVITKANIDTEQTLSVDGLELGDYELVLTMNVTVKDFTEKLSPISTQRALKIGTQAAAPTISSIKIDSEIQGTERQPVVVTFVGSKDDDFEISIADIKTSVEATQFPKNLDYQILLPAGASDNIKIPKGQTVDVTVELAVKLAEGSTDVNASGQVRGKLVFAAKALSVTQDVSKVKGDFVATQVASANLISQLFWTLFFMAIGIAVPLAVLLWITVLLSRFPDSSVSGSVTAASFNVHYANGQVTNAAELTAQASDLRNFPFIAIAEDRKSATIGMDTFSVKVNPFSLKSVSHAELSGNSEIGSNSTGDGKPYLSLNLGSEWVFFTGTSTVDVFADSATGMGTVVLVVNFNSQTAPELMADFLRSSAEILKKLPQKGAAGIFGDDSSGFDAFGGSTNTSTNNGNSGNDGFVGI